jgi:hypothetical protein
MPKGDSAMSGRGRLRIPRNIRRMLCILPRALVSREVFLFPMLLAHTMCVRRTVL